MKDERNDESFSPNLDIIILFLNYISFQRLDRVTFGDCVVFIVIRDISLTRLVVGTLPTFSLQNQVIDRNLKKKMKISDLSLYVLIVANDIT